MPNLLRYLMNSPAISRAVSRRSPDSKLTRPPAGRGRSSGPCSPRASGSDSNATVTGPDCGNVRATSTMILAGTSASALIPGSAGAKGASRAASRYRSVAASVMTSPVMSRQTAVSIGSVSSRLAAAATCPTAAASTAASTVPTGPGESGSAGYSCIGRQTRPNSAWPQRRFTTSPSAWNSAGRSGRLLVISASSRPGMSADPAAATSASTRTRADTS